LAQLRAAGRRPDADPADDRLSGAGHLVGRRPPQPAGLQPPRHLAAPEGPPGDLSRRACAVPRMPGGVRRGFRRLRRRVAVVSTAPRRLARAAEGRPRRGTPDGTRERLIAAAAEVINRDGYFGTDSNAIARAAGYSPATFYKHFEDK